MYIFGINHGIAPCGRGKAGVWEPSVMWLATVHPLEGKQPTGLTVLFTSPTGVSSRNTDLHGRRST